MTADKNDLAEEQQSPAAVEAVCRPQYEPPRVIVYDEDALAEIVGPAVACARWNPI